MTFTGEVIRSALIGGCAAMLASGVFAQTADHAAEAKAIIWAKEQKIYKDRASGSMDFYVASSSPHYLGWPPTASKPFPRQALPEHTSNIIGNKEKIETEFVDFTIDGDTALIYYNNHRTARGDGSPVDERFSNIHVWVERDGEWKLLGGMARVTAPPLK